MLRNRTFILIAVFFCLALNSSYADTIAPKLDPSRTSGADLNRILDDLQKKRIDRELKKELDSAEKKSEPTSVAPEPQTTVPETRVTLNRIDFNESSVLSQQQLSEFSKDYLNKEIGIADLKDFIGKINGWYRSHGYITAMAALPPQEIKSGILRVVLIEGKIGKVGVLGNTNTRADYIRKRINVPVGKLLDIRELDRDLIWFNGTNDLKARIKLQAGEKPGTTDCFILAYEPEDKTFNLFTDSAGSKSTGETRVGFSYSDASVSGRRDAFSLTSLMSNSSKAAMFAYNFPINKRGTKLSLYHSSNFLTVENSGLDIRGESESSGFSLTHPLRISNSFKSEVIFDAQTQRSTNSVFGLDFVSDREKRYSLGQSFLKLWRGNALFLRPMLTICDYKGLADQRKIQKYSLDGVWQKVNPGRQMLSVKLSGQKSQDDFVPSADQFFLGGLNSVRGYDESVISGDSGISLKFDYQFPLKFSKKTNMLAFYDWGKLFGKSFIPTRMIHSFGFGFNHSFAGDSMISLYVGYPIVKQIGAIDVEPQKIELMMNFSL